MEKLTKIYVNLDVKIKELPTMDHAEEKSETVLAIDSMQTQFVMLMDVVIEMLVMQDVVMQ